MRARNDFDYSLLAVSDHRPWALPESPWVMTQTWHNLLFAHWPIEPDVVRRLVPAALPLDLHEGQAWVGIIPFDMTNLAPRGIPALPRLSAFPELNVRTYVTRDGKPGVYFFSLDAAQPLAVRVARLLFHLPYHSATMHVETHGDWIAYASRRTGGDGNTAMFKARYRPAGLAQEPRLGTLEYFLTERYCLYTVDRRARPYRLEIHHKPWALQPALLDLSANTMADANGLQLPSEPPLLHFSRRQDIVAWPLKRI